MNPEGVTQTTYHPTTRGGFGPCIDAQLSGDSLPTVTIASVSDQEWHFSRTHGVYHIPACAKGERYAVLLIKSRGDVIDLGDNRRFPFAISGTEIALDLLQDLYDHGLFICAGTRPTEAELAAATARRNAHYHRLIGEGDVLWARGHSFREISDLHRLAAMTLGVERDWAYVPLRLSECPACGEKVKTGVAICKHCHGILDSEKAAQHGLVRKYSDEQPKGSMPNATDLGSTKAPTGL